MRMSRSEYTRVPDLELLEVPEGIRIQRSPWDQPSLTASNSGSICLTVDRKRHDRRKERLNTELLTAVFRSDHQQTIRLLELGASPDATCRPTRVSVCHIAALKGDKDILDILLTAGADFTARDREGRQPIHLAAWEGHVSILSMLLNMDEELINSPILVEEHPTHEIDCLDSWNHKHDELLHLVPDDVSEGSTSLHLACKRAHVNCVKMLIHMKANIHAEDLNGLTPLDVSGLCYDEIDNPVPKRRRNSSSNTTSSKEETPPLEDFRSKKIKKNPSLRNVVKPVYRVVNLLIERGANMPKGNLIKSRSLINSKKMSVTTLHTAVAKCELELIECLLQNGASLSTWNDEGETPIHLAIRKWFLDALKVLVSWDPKMIDVRDSEGRTPLHLAVLQEWSNGVEILLEAGADVTAVTNNRETVFHIAAQLGNRFMLEELLSVPDSTKVLEYRNTSMHTPIFQAVINNHSLCMEILCENGADLTVSVQGNFTLLHCATSNNSPEIVEYLLRDPEVAKKLKDVKLRDEKGGMTALHIAAKQGFVECIRPLLAARCDIYAKTSEEPEKCSTPLHLAAKYGCLEAIELIVSCDSNTLKSVNKDGWQPLHVAASSGHGECVKLMLKMGADISETVQDRSCKRSGLDIIMYCVPQPIDFIEQILDSYIEVNQRSLSDPECRITLKYQILVPNQESGKQLKVLNAVLNSGKRALQERFLLHPLVEIFLFLKWKRLRIFFTAIMAIHVILTLSLTVLAHLEYVEKNSTHVLKICVEVARGVLYASLLPIVIVEIVNASQLQRYYFLDFESWVKWAVIFSTIVVGLIDPNLVWARYVTSVAILIAWMELLFLLAHFPSWGFYVLMFSRVASNVFKVLGTFTFLVLGFTFAFLILFEANVPFRNFMESLVKVIVMMLEFDYENMFESAHEVTAFSIIGRFMFATFVVLVAMVMMNLMVGLAVSDIAELEAQGKTQRLAKQTAFLSFLERCVYNEKLQKVLPCGVFNVLKRRRAVPEVTVILPSQPMYSDDFVLPRAMKEAVLDRLWDQMGQKHNEISISLLDNKIDRLAGMVDNNLRSVRSSSNSSSISLSTENTLTEDTKSILKQILNDQRQLMDQIELVLKRN